MEKSIIKYAGKFWKIQLLPDKNRGRSCWIIPLMEETYVLGNNNLHLLKLNPVERRKITHFNKPTLRLTCQKSQQYNMVKIIQSTCIKKNHGQFIVHRGSNAVVLPAWLTTTISLAGLNYQLGNNWNFERWLEVQESYYLLFIEGINRAPASYDDSRWRYCSSVPIMKAIRCNKCSQIRTCNMKTIEDEEIFHRTTAYSTSSSKKTQQNKKNRTLLNPHVQSTIYCLSTLLIA